MLRDRPYLVVVALLSLLTLNWSILSVGIPLWVANHTDAPRWKSGAILTINALATVLLQVRLVPPDGDPLHAARAGRRAGLAIAVACVLFSTTAAFGRTPATLLLLLSGLVYVIGELLSMVCSWGVSVGLMPEAAKGEYQGVAATGTQAAQTVGPLVMTLLIVEWGQPGWLVLAVVFAATGLSIVGVTGWAARNRAAEAGGP